MLLTTCKLRLLFSYLVASLELYFSCFSVCLYPLLHVGVPTFFYFKGSIALAAKCHMFNWFHLFFSECVIVSIESIDLSLWLLAKFQVCLTKPLNLVSLWIYFVNVIALDPYVSRRITHVSNTTLQL